MKITFSFRGRACRKEWWLITFGWVMCQVIYTWVISGKQDLPAAAAGAGLLVFFVGIPIFLAVCWRRMHDTGRSGWYWLIPVYGFLVAGFEDSQKGANKYGPNPKDGGQEPEDSPPSSKPTEGGGETNRAFYGFAIAFVVLAGVMSLSTAFYKPQSGVNVRDEDGVTPLMHAAVNGRVKTIRELLKAGADIEARANVGFTALMLAAGSGQTKAIRELLKAGADIEARTNVGLTALMMAAYSGQTEAIRELLKAGADIEARDNSGTTVLEYAVVFNQAKAIGELVKAGADVDTRGDEYGVTVLMRAAWKGHTEAIRELLKAGADKRVNVNGYTAFDLWQEHNKNHPDFWRISNLLRP